MLLLLRRRFHGWVWGIVKQHEPSNGGYCAHLRRADVRPCAAPSQAQALSNTAWALATLGHLPGGGLLDKLAMRAADIISTFRPQATSNTLCDPLQLLPLTNAGKPAMRAYFQPRICKRYKAHRDFVLYRHYCRGSHCESS